MTSALTPLQKELRRPETFYIPFLQMLQDNGGEIDKLDVLVPQYTDFTAEDLKNTVVSKKSGKPWRPYDFGRNFALKNLKLAGYITYSRSEPMKLTKKGLDCDLSSFDCERDVNSLTRDYWKKKTEERLKKASSSEIVAATEDEPEEQEIENIETESDWREAILNKVKGLSPKKFEEFCRGLLNKMGFEIDSFKGVSVSHDFGIDGFGYSMDSQSLKTTRVAIQCKRYDGHPVGSAEINNLRGSVDTNRADYGVFITTSYYSTDAKKSSRVGSTPITLIDGDKLVDLMVQYNYKVKSVISYVPDETYFDADN